MKSVEATALVLPVVIVLLLSASCSSPRTAVNGNSSPAGSPESKTAEGPLFEVLNAWKPRKVTVETYAIGDEPAPRYTLTPKAGVAFVAVELMLKRDDSRKPVPAAMWGGTVLVDSAGKPHQLFFSYPSTGAKYTPYADSVEYSGDKTAKSDDLIGKKLSEMGGKLVVVFDAPPNDTEFKLEVTNAAPLQVSIKTK
jgi:hypothetical protein